MHVDCQCVATRLGDRGSRDMLPLVILEAGRSEETVFTADPKDVNALFQTYCWRVFSKVDEADRRDLDARIMRLGTLQEPHDANAWNL
jgi:hypothetical protein